MTSLCGVLGFVLQVFEGLVRDFYPPGALYLMYWAPGSGAAPQYGLRIPCTRLGAQRNSSAKIEKGLARKTPQSMGGQESAAGSQVMMATFSFVSRCCRGIGHAQEPLTFDLLQTSRNGLAPQDSEIKFWLITSDKVPGKSEIRVFCSLDVWCFHGPGPGFKGSSGGFSP